MLRSIQIILTQLTASGYCALVISRGKKVKSIIRSWKARQRFNKGRPRYHTDGLKKTGFSVSIDKLNDAIYC